MPEHYYKFRSLQNLRRFLDIVVNERLYAAGYGELNDPMEGAYLVDYRNRDIIRLLRIKKDKTRICSLSKDYRHILLWSHYADGHKGCCIEVSMRDPGATLRDINYVSELQTVDRAVDAEELLSYKSKSWEYEQEIRLFGRSKYRRVYLHQIIFGMRVSENDFRFYENLINRINPDIAVRKISEDELETGYERY